MGKPYATEIENDIKDPELRDSDSPSGASPEAPEFGDLDLVPEAELAQHYLTHTWRTFAASSTCQVQSDSWQIFLPAQGLTCPVVRRGILVLAAMCLHHDSTADRPSGHSSKYLETAEAHGRIFVQESRQKIQKFQDSDVDSILACSRLLCVLGFAFFHIHRQNGATLADREAWTWFQLVRGVKATWIAIVESGKKINDIVARDMAADPPSINLTTTSRGHRDGHRPVFDYFLRLRWERFHALRAALRNSQALLDEYQSEYLGAAVDLLYEISGHICSDEVPSLFRIVCKWPGHVSNGFVDMLMDGSPLTLAIYAHFLMSVVLVEDLWWVSDMGRAGIRDVVAMSKNAGSDIDALLRWPQHMSSL